MNLSKKARQEFWLGFGCVRFIIGIYRTFGQGGVLILGGGCLMARYLLETRYPGT